ncbi:RAB6-interacting golgin isoform X2 [Manis pentadactyla]|uniref:RAB6-interacting golgin isoform X2 n=1 Tax=Manis pentadactyla TaxID=143292 RepID=UPI00255CEC87|nr:RAB6-interacting golgin isoform X2 [Manis pentadactyla]
MARRADWPGGAAGLNPDVPGGPAGSRCRVWPRSAVGRMARAWAGFSEEELRRLRRGGDPFEPQQCLSVKKSQQLQRRKLLQEQSQKLGLQDGSTSGPPEQLRPAPDQRLSAPKPHSSPRPAPGPLTLTSPGADGEPQGVGSRPGTLGLENSHDGLRSAEALPPKPDCTPGEKKVELQEKSRWEVLQQEQRLMEEKNKRKKALLAEAIAERSKRTQAETMKLKRIQKELQALDDMVSADIGILRNRIDEASLEYAYARKRFDRAEAEYVAAKLDLQRKTEVKEQLTEHLCTIIQQNELRKARKLEELLRQLDVQADEGTLGLGVEAERSTQEREADARKVPPRPGRPCPPAGNSVAVGFAGENERHQEQAASPKAGERCGQAGGIRRPHPDGPGPEVSPAAGGAPAALTA